MGNLGRRIGLSQNQGDSNPVGANGAVGGGILDLFGNEYFERQGGIYNAPGASPQGIEATGGVISDYSSGPKFYRAHVYTSSGVFDVSAVGSYGNTVEFLVVGGGGGGGFGGNAGGGGGAGGLRTNLTGHPKAPNESPFTVSTSPGQYTVTVGGGGDGTRGQGGNGTPSVFGPGPLTSQGGGGGGGPNSGGTTGGSGGGGGTHPGGGPKAGGDGNKVTGSSTAAPTQGNPGGTGNHVAGSWEGGGGGGGAGGAGGNASPGPGAASYGGAGLQVAIAGPTTVTAVGGLNPQTNERQWFAGGGGGAPRGVGGAGSALAVGTANRAGAGEGAPGSDGTVGGHGESGTGSGGGGNGWGNGFGGNGGAGIVVVRYQIAEISSQKATGGSVSFYGGKTIHTFLSSGTFTAPGTFNETIRYVAVGGGGGGGVQHGGGGGAGGYTTAEIPLNAGGSTVPIAIVIGAGGAGMPAKGSLLGTAGGPENNGNNTTVAFPSPVTAGYGGGGAQLGPPSGSPLGVGANAPLGSGGGGGMKQPGQTGDNKGTGGPQGNHGGSAITYSGGGVGGGGGGAGAVGGNPSSPNPEKGAGGIGVQVHPAFRDPAAAPTATTPTEPRFAGERGGGLGTPGPAGQFYLAGGGGGAAHTNWPYSVDSKWGADGGFGGGGHGGNNTPGSETQYHQGTHAVVNTGGGGGATGPHEKPAGSGGSGIVLIAYPT